jgi:hypothetical protein
MGWLYSCHSLTAGVIKKCQLVLPLFSTGQPSCSDSMYNTMGISAASMLQLFTIHSSLTWSENLFGGTITWALEVPSHLHLSLTIERNVDTGQLLCTNCWHFFSVCHSEISTGHNSMSYTHSEGCTDLHSVAFTVVFSVFRWISCCGETSIFLSVHLLITNFILAIVKKYDPYLFNPVLFHVIMYVRLTISELGTLHSFWGRSHSFWNCVSWVQFSRLNMSRAKSNLIMIQNVEGNFPGPESTLDRLAILQECDVYVEGICHWSWVYYQHIVNSAIS